MGKIMAVRNSLWRRKYGNCAKMNAAFLKHQASVSECIAVTLSHGRGSVRKRVGARKSEGHGDATWKLAVLAHWHPEGNPKCLE